MNNDSKNPAASDEKKNDEIRKIEIKTAIRAGSSKNRYGRQQWWAFWRR